MELWGDDFVGVNEESPGTFGVGESEVSLRGEVGLEVMSDNGGAGFGGNGGGSVAGVVVDNEDLVGKTDRFDGGGNLFGFVVGENNSTKSHGVRGRVMVMGEKE